MQFELNNQTVEDFNLIEVFDDRITENKTAYQMVKRLTDAAASFIAFAVTLPLVLLACCFIAVETKAFPIYIQERLGLNGKKFKIYKIRTMYKDAEKHGPKWAEKNDKRVTRVGRFLRRSRIDELPQLLNILMGDMSIVGPRPEREAFTHQFEREIPGFVKRLQVKPGLTGYAQVNGGYDLTPKEKFLLDSVYMSDMSLLLDLRIMLKTVTIVFSGKGSR